MPRYKKGDCQKCQTKFTEVREYNDRWLGIPCLCYQEEVEKDSGKIEKDLEGLENYRRLVAGTKGIPASSA